MQPRITQVPPTRPASQSATLAPYDAARRAQLFSLLAEAGGQVWMTGTDRALFSALAGNAEFYAMSAAVPERRREAAP